MIQQNEWNDITIRTLKAGDENLINDFFDRMGGESRALFNRRDYNRRGVLKQCTKPLSDRCYWLAILDGAMVGYVFYLDWDTGVPELGIAVRDDLRGQRLGKRLMMYAIDEAKMHGKGGIYLTTHTANLRGQALYDAMGFTCMGVAKNGTELMYLYRFRNNESII
ncbi:MAG: GNAT family N-acetyltransferase [Clostridia bacterium]|nr:GNAT family N-acetyltransferase [Clostridia bacterium]